MEWLTTFDIYQTIFWSVAYIECIRIAIVQKTYCMPLLAMTMSFCWELLSLFDCIANGVNNNSCLITYFLWTVLDVGIVITFLLYARAEWKKNGIDLSRISFSVITTASFVFIAGVLAWMYHNVENWKLYFAFVDNLLISGLFIVLYTIRRGGYGQSLSIAVTKCIGTLCATSATMITNTSIVVITIGWLCFIIDVVYICLLWQNKYKYLSL